MLELVGAPLGLTYIAAQFSCGLLGSNSNSLMDENNMGMLQGFGFLVGVAVLVMRTAEFEPLVIRSMLPAHDNCIYSAWDI